MFEKGLATLVILLFLGLAVSTSIYADRDKVSIETTTEFDYDGYTHIQLVFLLINKLRYYKGVEYVESEDDVLQIIEDDAELSGIVEEVKSFDCGCVENSLDWKFPIICNILYPIKEIASNIWKIGGFLIPIYIMVFLGTIFNCYWLDGYSTLP